MLFHSILFYAFAAIMFGAALGVVFSRNPVHAVMFLVLTFFNAAVLWLMAEAEFLAIVLVLVYVGAVMVLFLFVVMMLEVIVIERLGITTTSPATTCRGPWTGSQPFDSRARMPASGTPSPRRPVARGGTRVISSVSASPRPEA